MPSEKKNILPKSTDMQTSTQTLGHTTVISSVDNQSQDASWFDLNISHVICNILPIKCVATCISRKPKEAVQDKPEQYKFPGTTLDRACSELNILHMSDNMFISVACSVETAYHAAAAWVESTLYKMSEWNKYMIIEVVSYWFPEHTRKLVVVWSSYNSVLFQ